MNVIDQQVYANLSQRPPVPDVLVPGRRVESKTQAVTSNVRMSLCLAWAVRVALLVLYIPVQIMSALVQATHQLDLWACKVVTQAAGETGNYRLEKRSGERIAFRPTIGAD